jgi:VanZ family protein
MKKTLLAASKRFLLPAIWLGCITWLSTKGGVSLPSFSLIGIDKLGHAAAYGLLVGLLHTAFPPANQRQAVGIWLFASMYGAFMECIQYTFFPNRMFEFDDMLANAIGALLVWGVFWVKKINRKR